MIKRLHLKQVTCSKIYISNIINTEAVRTLQNKLLGVNSFFATKSRKIANKNAPFDLKKKEGKTNRTHGLLRGGMIVSQRTKIPGFGSLNMSLRVRRLLYVN